MPWSSEEAVKTLQTSKQASSVGKCAAYTRTAIEAGGVVLARKASAKDYGISLMAAGFRPLPYDTGEYLPGDVVVIDGFEGNPHGHMAMWDGSQWISDFSQKALYPGAAYRKHKPAYKIYRFMILWDALGAPRSGGLA